MLLPLYCRLNANLLFGFVKLIGCITSAVNVVSSNPWVGPLPRVRISLFLLSTCTDELISTPKIMIFLHICK